MSLEILANEAAHHWGGQVRGFLSNRENAVFEINLPKGRAALRLHREGYQNADNIQSELWLMEKLAAAGLPVPSALASLDGTNLVTLSTGRQASVISWREGEAMGFAGVAFAAATEILLSRHARLGQLLAEIHRTADGLTLPQSFVRPVWDSSGLVGELPIWGRFWEHPLATPTQSAALAECRSYLQNMLTRSDVGGVGLIHADVLRENVLVQGDSLSLIDFDDSGFGYRLYDLGTVLSQNLYEPAFNEIRAALIEGYGLSHPMSCDLVDAFTLSRVCASVGWAMPRLAIDHPTHGAHLARAMHAIDLFVPR